MSSQVDGHDEARELRSFGYEQQLSRSMGVFSSLSISISCMCITAGIFTVYAYALSTAGPAFVWTWPVVAVGQLTLALVFADLAREYPLCGGVYAWSRRTGSAALGWLTGWVYLASLVVTLAAAGSLGRCAPPHASTSESEPTRRERIIRRSLLQRVATSAANCGQRATSMVSVTDASSPASSSADQAAGALSTPS